MYYRIVLYKNDKILPFLFLTKEEADTFIFMYNLKAYITITERED